MLAESRLLMLHMLFLAQYQITCGCRGLFDDLEAVLSSRRRPDVAGPTEADITLQPHLVFLALPTKLSFY